MLTNPQFRKVFLARVRKIVEEVFTEEIYYPIIDGLVARLGDDAALHAQLKGGEEDAGRRNLSQSAEFLKTFLRKRREFLLSQEELRR